MIVQTFLSIYSSRTVVSKVKQLLIQIPVLVVNLVCLYYIPNILLRSLVNYIMIIVLSYIYELKMPKRLFLTLLIFLLQMIVEVLAGNLIILIHGLSADQISSNMFVSLQIAVTSKLILYSILMIVKYFSKNNATSLSGVVMVSLAIFPIISFGIIALLIELQVYIIAYEFTIWLIIGAILLLIGNLFIYFIFNYTMTVKERQVRAEFDSAHIKNDYDNMASSLEMYTVSSKTLHDITHKMYEIRELMDNDILSAKSHMDTMCEIVKSNANIMYTNIKSIDSLLNVKRHKAMQEGIELLIQINIGGIVKVDAIDFCIILGNLIDNSIESTLGIVDEYNLINLEIKQRKNFLSITVENACLNKELCMKSIKKNSEVHGHGISNVREIVDKYCGQFNQGIVDGKYIVNIVI